MVPTKDLRETRFDFLTLESPLSEWVSFYQQLWRARREARSPIEWKR